MYLKPLNRVRKTLGFRLTAWYSGLFTLSTLALFGTAYVLLSSSLQRRDREAIHLKLKEYAAEYQLGGREAIERKLAFETLQMGKARFFVRVAGPDNRTLFCTSAKPWKDFDVAQLEKISVSAATPWVYVPSTEADEDDVLEIASVPLADGSLLQVGTSTEGREDLLEQFGGAFAGVMIPVVVIGLAGGSFLAFRALRPLRGFITSLQSIVTTGNLTARVPVADTGDELDELSILFNGLLAKIGLLIAGMQNSLDNVAHDLRTPMTRLRGIAEMALQAEKKEDLLREALVTCVEESERILAMVNTLMDISEAETGAMRLDLQTVQVSALLEQVVELYRYVAEDKAITLSVSVLPELSLTVDRNRMLQVLTNLLDNAIKYTPRGGNVEVAASSLGHQVMITVTDTGIGIPPEELAKIWDRLYRGDKSRSQRGLGLGLSLVKAIVQAHQGQVEVSNEIGQGTQFALHLPAQTPA
jgi:signal transduction histidine kinase